MPPGFVSTLEQMVQSPTLELGVTRGGTSGRVRQQVQALVYQLNLKLQHAYIAANIALRPADPARRARQVPRPKFNLIGLDGTAKELAALPQSDRVQKIEHFVHDARLALAQTDNALRATAEPIQLVEEPAARPLGPRLRAGAELRASA